MGNENQNAVRKPVVNGNPDITVEVNGVANLMTMMDPDMKGSFTDAEIMAELDIMNRYMVELGAAAREGRKNAYWHEVKENPSKYPTNKELLRG